MFIVLSILPMFINYIHNIISPNIDYLIDKYYKNKQFDNIIEIHLDKKMDIIFNQIHDFYIEKCNISDYSIIISKILNDMKYNNDKYIKPTRFVEDILYDLLFSDGLDKNNKNLYIKLIITIKYLNEYEKKNTEIKCSCINYDTMCECFHSRWADNYQLYHKRNSKYIKTHVKICIKYFKKTYDKMRIYSDKSAYYNDNRKRHNKYILSLGVVDSSVNYNTYKRLTNIIFL